MTYLYDSINIHAAPLPYRPSNLSYPSFSRPSRASILGQPLIMGVPPERSLHASMWAPHSHHDNDRPSAYTTPNPPASMIINQCPNDWICPSCEGLNFQRRAPCFQCSEARPQKENQVYMQPAFAASCPSNATPSQPLSKVREPASSDDNAAEFPTKFLAELENGQRGLASSRFAPKAYRTCTNYKSQVRIIHLP